MSKEDNQKKKEECPLCNVSEETLKKLRETSEGGFDKNPEKLAQKKKKNFWQRLFKK